MVGIDISLRPVVWACRAGSRWLHGVLGDPPAPSLLEALKTAGVRDRTAALAVSSRDVRIGMLPDVVRGARARRAAMLAACQQLGAGPRDVALSVDRGPKGTSYAAALRETVAAWTRPWRDARIGVRVVEPAAIALLRALAGDDTGLVVSAGEGMLELIVGSRSAFVHARAVEADWAARPPVARLEVEETLAAVASRHNVEIGWLAVCGRGPIDALARALAGVAPLRDLREARLPGMDTLPPSAAAAASVALWERTARAWSGGGSWGLGPLARLLSRRRGRAA
jgi:hypothetical protein